MCTLERSSASSEFGRAGDRIRCYWHFAIAAAKKVLDAIKARKVYAKWKSKRPASYDYNLVVIGAGSAGLVSAYIAAATKAKVALIEKHKMGGDCLNTGCVPSKALIRSAKLLSHIARSREFGIDQANAKVQLFRRDGASFASRPGSRAA